MNTELREKAVMMALHAIGEDNRDELELYADRIYNFIIGRYKEVTESKYEDLLDRFKDGELLTREGWGNKFIQYCKPTTRFHQLGDFGFERQPYISVYEDGKVNVWVPTAEDFLAEDWAVTLLPVPGEEIDEDDYKECSSIEEAVNEFLKANL